MCYFAEFQIDGFTIKARTKFDEDTTPPWERADGHGPVSEWTTRSKQPGERVLSTHRSMYRYYDVQEAIRIAKRDGWATGPDAKGSKGERAAAAVEADFQFLRSWCNDEWHYCGVILSVEKNGIVLNNHAASVWGVEDNDESYLKQLAEEMVDEAVAVGRETSAKITA